MGLLSLAASFSSYPLFGGLFWGGGSPFLYICLFVWKSFFPFASPLFLELWGERGGGERDRHGMFAFVCRFLLPPFPLRIL